MGRDSQPSLRKRVVVGVGAAAVTGVTLCLAWIYLSDLGFITVILLLLLVATLLESWR